MKDRNQLGAGLDVKVGEGGKTETLIVDLQTNASFL